jgi:hypothetical protein
MLFPTLLPKSKSILGFHFLPDRQASGCSTAHHKMQDERYRRKDEKYVDETASNVEHCESP